MKVHVQLKNMATWIMFIEMVILYISLKEDYALLEELFCSRSCASVVLVFMMAYLAICLVLQKDIS